MVMNRKILKMNIMDSLDWSEFYFKMCPEIFEDIQNAIDYIVENIDSISKNKFNCCNTQLYKNNIELYKKLISIALSFYDKKGG